MRFETKEDAAMFLLECDRPDLAATAGKDFSPDEELVELFIQRRKNVVRHLKDFRRQQNTKQQWRHNRYEMMKGIKTFHRSTRGKKFHRALGRFLSTRIPLSGGSLLAVRDLGESYLRELGEVFKALSSYKTHAWIQIDNYMSVSETADYELFLEEACAAVAHVEAELMKPEPVLEAGKLDFLLATLNHKCVFDALSDDDAGFEALQEAFDKTLELHKEAEYPYLATLRKIKEKQ
jgi:hypothetical protein